MVISLSTLVLAFLVLAGCLYGTLKQRTESEGTYYIICTALCMLVLVYEGWVCVSRGGADDSLISVAAVAATVVLFAVYVHAQITAITKGRDRERQLEEMSMVDTLTGVNNERALRAQVDKLINDERVGVVYTAAVSHGKKADSMVLELTEILKQYFRAGDIFRLSSGEFVLLVPRIGQKLFMGKIDKLDKALEEHHIASMGSSYGYGKDLQVLIKEAEEKMHMCRTGE